MVELELPSMVKIHLVVNISRIYRYVEQVEEQKREQLVINFIWPYLYQFFDNSHSLNGTQKPLKRPFN